MVPGLGAKMIYPLVPKKEFAVAPGVSVSCRDIFKLAENTRRDPELVKRTKIRVFCEKILEKQPAYGNFTREQKDSFLDGMVPYIRHNLYYGDTRFSGNVERKEMSYTSEDKLVNAGFIVAGASTVLYGLDKLFLGNLIGPIADFVAFAAAVEIGLAPGIDSAASSIFGGSGKLDTVVNPVCNFFYNLVHAPLETFRFFLEGNQYLKSGKEMLLVYTESFAEHLNAEKQIPKSLAFSAMLGAKAK